MRTQKTLDNIAEAVLTTIGSDEPNFYDVLLKDGYRLSILTGSHYDSSKLKTVEVALMDQKGFAFDGHSDNSIINYLKFEIFLDFITDVETWQNGCYVVKNIKDIFKEYQNNY